MIHVNPTLFAGASSLVVIIVVNNLLTRRSDAMAAARILRGCSGYSSIMY
jgi:hypothetical protein